MESHIPKMPDVKEDIYQIKVKGALDSSWSEWFSGMTILPAEDENGGLFTILSGTFLDQAALRGVMNKLWDLNVTLIAVHLTNPLEEEQLKQTEV